jgi:hypothetical protein
MSDNDEQKYGDMTIAELKELLRARNLQVSGNKATLIERLESDEAQAEVEKQAPMPKGFEPVVGVGSAETVSAAPPAPDLVMPMLEAAILVESEAEETSLNVDENERSDIDSLLDEMRNTVAQLKTLVEVTAHTVEAQIATLAGAVKKATEDATNSAMQSDAAKAATDAASKAQKMAGNAASTASNEAKGAAKKVKKASKKLKKK